MAVRAAPRADAAPRLDALPLLAPLPGAALRGGRRRLGGLAWSTRRSRPPPQEPRARLVAARDRADDPRRDRRGRVHLPRRRLDEPRSPPEPWPSWRRPDADRRRTSRRRCSRTTRADRSRTSIAAGSTTATRSRSTTSRLGGRRVDGFLALPPGQTRLPAVVYVDGSGGDRTELIVEATGLAGRGAVALTITAPSATAASETGFRPSPPSSGSGI